MHRKFLSLIVLALLAVAFSPALAQANLLAYVYNGETKTLIGINSDGSTADYNLGLPTDSFVSSFDMAFTADGSKVALCAVSYPAGMGETAVQPTATFILRDIAAGTNLIEQNLGAAIGCRTGQHAFNADETQIALSRINYYPGDPNADLSLPSWQLTLIDAASGNTLAELNNQSPAVVEYTLASEGIIPYVQRVQGNSVIFAEVPYGIGGGAEWAAYEWLTDAGTVTPVTVWGNIDLDTLSSTGETIWTGIDDSRPAATPNGPVPPNNVVRLMDSAGQETVIFHTPDWQVLDANFIEGGQRIAVMLYSFDPQTSLPNVRWVALDRAGTQTTLVESPGNAQVETAPGGYVSLVQEGQLDGVTIPQFKLNFAAVGGQPAQLWASDTTQMAYWELAWVASDTGATGLPPFPVV